MKLWNKKFGRKGAMPIYNKFMASSGDNTKFRCQVTGQKTDFISFVIQRIVGAQVDGPV